MYQKLPQDVRQQVLELEEELTAARMAHQQISNRLWTVIRPILKKNDLSLNCQLLELLTNPDYCQSETSRQIDALQSFTSQVVQKLST